MHVTADGRRFWFTHGNHTLELVWSIIPGLTLLFLAFYQIDVWAKFRIKSTVPKEVLNRPVAEITARQFEWRIRYPAPGKVLQPKPQPDDIYAVNELHVPEGRLVNVRLVSEDVLHSFFVPHLRIKQDAVPGLAVPVWFQATKAGRYEIVCAELCGWGHYRMIGRVYVHKDQAEFLDWLTKAEAHQGSWWPNWAEWIESHSKGKKVPAYVPGSGALKPIEPAPGSYVRAG